jgi:hypothetical protein
MKLKNLLILAFLLACVTGFSMSSVSARHILISEKLEYQGGTFTWEDNSDSLAYRRVYSDFGLGRTVVICNIDEIKLDEFDGWFKDHSFADAKFYYNLASLSTPWTGCHMINRGDNVTIRTNSWWYQPWIEYYINGKEVDRKYY